MMNVDLYVLDSFTSKSPTVQYYPGVFYYPWYLSGSNLIGLARLGPNYNGYNMVWDRSNNQTTRLANLRCPYSNCSYEGKGYFK